MRTKYLLIFTMFLLSANSLYAQSQGLVYTPNSSVKVYAYGQERTLAWCGGFNNPQIQLADLNNDGVEDMVVYENTVGVRTFINTGTNSNAIYTYAPEYAANFTVYSFLILKDYNCDGIPDLFTSTGTTVSVSKGYYTSKNQLAFHIFTYLYYYNDANSGYNKTGVYLNAGDIPSVVDVDNDGDLDIVAYSPFGGSVIWLYKNMRVEKGYPCDSFLVQLKDRCWGKVSQGFPRTHTLQYSCDESGLNKQTQKTHSGNTICLFDYDGDGDYDYLDGSISYNEMTFLQNGRIPYNSVGPDSMVKQDTFWQSNGHIVELPLWPAAYNLDVDHDGKKDLLISPTAANTSENYKCIWYYKNLTTPGNPSFVFQSDTFLIDRSIDLGTGAFPTLFDYNKDGKPDLFIGSDGYYQPSGYLRSRLSYYLNTSTPGNPSFTLQTDNFLNTNTYNFQGEAPAMGDLNQDGKKDMIVGHTDGTLSLFTNNAASDTVMPMWQMSQQTLKDVDTHTISVNSNAAPVIYDINKDGKPDLLIGSFGGTITYYQNVSTVPGTVALKFITSNLGGVKVDAGGGSVFGLHSTPFIGKMDNTQKDYLLIGTNSGVLYRYDGFQGGNVTDSFKLIDTRYSYINYATTNFRSAPVVGDIDGDGKYEMILGAGYGGVQFYKQTLDVAGISNVNANSDLNVHIYPNPAKDNITIALDEALTHTAQVRIINMQGQQVTAATATAGLKEISLQLGNLPSGMYVCIVEVNNNKSYNRFTVLK